MTHNRIFRTLAAALLIAAMMTCAAPFGALAAGDMTGVSDVIVTVYNPLYSDLGTLETPIDPEEVPVTDGDADVEYLDADAAAQEMRNHMAARDTTATVYIKTADTGTDSDTRSALAKSLWNDTVWPKVLAHTGVSTEGDYLRWSWSSCSSSISWSSNGSTLMVTYTLTLVYHDTAEQEAAVTAALPGIYESLNLDACATDYAKTKAIYDYITQNTTYDDENMNEDSSHSAYSCIIKHSTVCQGYSLAMYRMLLDNGVDCRIVDGYANGSAHGWLLIRMDDGNYYYADATWDSNIYEYSGVMTYDYFLYSSEFADHTLSDDAKAIAAGCTIVNDGTYYDGSYIPPAPVLGDLNGDGTIDMTDRDLLITAVFYASTDADLLKVGDMDGNGSFNLGDIYILRALIASQN